MVYMAKSWSILPQMTFTFTSHLCEIRKLHSTRWFLHKALLLHDLFGKMFPRLMGKAIVIADILRVEQKVTKRDLLLYTLRRALGGAMSSPGYAYLVRKFVCLC